MNHEMTGTAAAVADGEPLKSVIGDLRRRAPRGYSFTARGERSSPI